MKICKRNDILKIDNWLTFLQLKDKIIIFILKLSSLKMHHKMWWLWRHLASKF